MFKLYFVRYLHYLIEIFYTTYIFIFPKKFDLYFSLTIFILCFHWIIFKHECILSYLEKQIIDPNYELGSDPKKHIHRELLLPAIQFLINILFVVNLLVVLYRNNSTLIRSLLIGAISIFLYYQTIFCNPKEKEKTS
jgi:hypothetical protein